MSISTVLLYTLHSKPYTEHEWISIIIDVLNLI